MAPREREVNYDNNMSTSFGSTASLKLDLKPEDKWMSNVDLKAFGDDIRELGKKLSAEQGPADVAHLDKIILWSNLFTFSGIFTCGVVPFYYIFPAVLLSIGLTSRWVMIAHHTCHGGYDNCEKSGRFNRFKFAVGSLWRRTIDWMDWMHPEAWNVEHNNLHHYHLGEDGDPDLVERNLESIREMNAPMFVKYIIVGILILGWKWLYYAPNTYKELRIKETRKTNPKLLEKCFNEPKYDLTGPYMLYNYFTMELPPFITATSLMTRVLLPNFFYRFLILPSPWLLVGYYMSPENPTAMFVNAFVSLMIADIFSNIHTFIIVVPNHAGDDLYKFSSHCKPRSAMFFMRQVISSANFAAGTDGIDFFHGWLNYQIEHHLWPDLSMRSYQRALPLVKELCKYHGIPYVQESVFTRVRKTVDIMVGKADMKEFPEGVFAPSCSE